MRDQTINFAATGVFCCVLAALSGCGGGGSSTYTIGGTVSGLAGDGLVLQDNGADDLHVAANGSFTFTTALASGTAYAVTVLTQPNGSAQICTVTGGSGTVSGSNVTTVTVVCKTADAHAVGGTVSGLSGSGLVLRDNGGDDLPVSANGAFSFATPLTTGSAYHVTVAAQPGNPVQNCILRNGSSQGTVASADVASVVVVCANVGRFVYTANRGDGTISGYTIDATTGAITSLPGYPYGGSTRASYVAADPAGPYLVALDNEGGSEGIAAPGIDLFSIDGSGILTALPGSPFPTDAGALAMAIAPNGNFGYTANVNSTSVSGYTVDRSAGSIVPVAGSPYASDAFPMSIAISPSGTFAYTANSVGTVWGYSINATTGALTPLAGGSFPAGSAPTSVIVDPSGKYVYVADGGSNEVAAFSINAATGLLTPVPGSPFSAGLTPTAVAVDPSGTFLFVANGDGMGTPGGQTLSVFLIDPDTGALTSGPGSPYACDTLPSAIAVDPSGKFVYVANGDPPANNISGFAIDTNTGALTAVPGSPFAAGPNPQSITVAP